MCVCVCPMYICIHIYIYRYIPIYTYIYMYIYTYIGGTGKYYRSLKEIDGYTSSDYIHRKGSRST